MRWVLTIVGIVMIVFGAIWFLQGVGALPGSFMTGSRFWAIVGSLVGLVGIALLIGATRWRKLA